MAGDPPGRCTANCSGWATWSRSTSSLVNGCLRSAPRRQRPIDRLRIHLEFRQLGLFGDPPLDYKSLTVASDLIVNDRHGGLTLVLAKMASMQDVILKRVAFGNVRGFIGCQKYRSP